MSYEGTEAKREQKLHDLEEILICPICKEKLNIDKISLTCPNNHTFNISKKGTAVLYKTSKLKNDKIYTKDLFVKRRNFINCGFYNELYDKIYNIIKNYENKIILDMGSGEGTHDYKIKQFLNSNTSKIIGIDLSKDAVDLFNDYIDNNFLGIVADLNNVPFVNNTIDIILNILSPSNEMEIIIKVTPKMQYLHELREALNIKDYENEKIINENINKKYEIISKEEYVKTFPLDGNSLNYLINMTPLLSNYKEIPKIDYITIALNIYVLKKKNN